MKNQTSNRGKETKENFKNGPKSIPMNKKKNNSYQKNKRLGGKGLSLAAFANAKTKNNDYNPALIKKQREFYKNAKYVSKYKKTLKQLNESQSQPPAVTNLLEDGDETGTARKINNKSKKNSSQSLTQVYESKRQEEEKARMEKEALLQAKKEAREKAETQRKEQRAKMYKRTRSGQPVMKYRIEHLLESLQR